MTSNRTSSSNPIRIPRPGAAVKARIVAAGLTQAQIAHKARIAKSTLSDYIAGRIRNIHGQIDIMLAFCDLSGQSLKVSEFWGELAAEEAA